MSHKKQTEQGWETEVIPFFNKGINVFDRADTLDPAELTDAHSVYMEQGLLKVDTGYKTYLGVVRGNTRVTRQVYYKDGTADLVLVTNATFYKLANSEWQYVSNGTETTTTGAHAAGATNILVGASAGFSVSDYIGVLLDNGAQHQTTVSAIPDATHITMTDAVPVGRSITATSPFVMAIALSGSDDTQVSYVTVPSSDWFVFSNGVDKPQRFDKSTVEVVPNLPSGGNTTCLVVSLFENHLLLLATTEAGTSYPQRVRNADTGDPTNWSTGNAGFTDLYNSDDAIVGALLLGPYNIIYRDSSIIRMEWVGSSDTLFNFNKVLSKEGAISLDAIIDLGDFHVFAGRTNIYKYSGGFELDPIGNNIYYHIYGSKGEIVPTYRGKIFMIYVEELNEAWFFYPAGNATEPNHMHRWSFNNKAWLHREFASSFVGYGVYKETNATSWSGAAGLWTDYNYPWNSQSVLANSPIILLCYGTQVYSYDYKNLTDNGTNIDYTVTTKEFTFPGFEIRVDNVSLQARGTSILIEYSTNGGTSWNTMGTINPGSELQVLNVYEQFIGDSAMFKITGTSGGFQLGRMEFDYILEAKN